jgi:meso-butanediol dehydrogenase / (S,S)-butanediol dehydrogenase / diacetyl reductase
MSSAGPAFTQVGPGDAGTKLTTQSEPSTGAKTGGLTDTTTGTSTGGATCDKPATPSGAVALTVRSAKRRASAADAASRAGRTMSSSDAPPSGGRLAGRKVLITGASRGIGRAIALRYAREGAELFLVATQREGLDETRRLLFAESPSAAAAHVHVTDVSQRDAVQHMVETAAATMGCIDVLVNNAGVYHAARLVDIEAEAFDRIMQVNVYGAFHVLQFVLRQMQAQKRGKVVNIASTAGKWGSMNQAAYNASKHALVGLTRCAALEMGGLGITVNAICPGFVETDMLGEFRAHADILGVPFETVLENGRQRVPLKRFLKADEIAHLAVYLGSAESDGMTGQSLLIDGGMVMV